MCGVAGFLDFTRANDADALRLQARRMARRLNHRGPDSSGEWVDEGSGVALGYRRLAVIDLSSTGDQPMVSACGRYVIAFNGEIYNFEDLRNELASYGQDFQWRGHSDTEVLLEAVARWGLEDALKKTNGMFSFVLWDREKCELLLARDRLGEKPLYFGWSRGVFLFGSELKALREHSSWEGDVDRDALALFLRFNCIPAPFSIYRGIRKLPPATWLRVRRDSSGRFAEEDPVEYWSARSKVEAGTDRPFTGSETDAVHALDTLLRDAVRRRMHADVPLGAFLSGGIDSSTIVAMMQAQSRIPVRTYSIGFHNEAYNEAGEAGEIAAHLGTDHTELYISPDEAQDVIPLLPTLYDEPFSDSSQIPTYLVSKLASQEVTVSLSGDGGDEVFGGYNRHLWVPSVWRWIRRVPRPARRAARAAFGSLSPARWDAMFRVFGPILPRWAVQRTPGYKLQKLADAFQAQDPAAIYCMLASHWKQPETVVLGSHEPLTLVRDSPAWPLSRDRISEQMMYLDLVTYLPDDILVKLDRASMAVSLEARAPFLDHRLVEFAWTLPQKMKIRDGQGKYILRQVLERYVPRELTDRPKSGFGMPIGDWLRGPLRDWAENLIDVTRLKQDGYFDPLPIHKKWEEHLSGVRNWEYHLWDILMFQAWAEGCDAG